MNTKLPSKPRVIFGVEDPSRIKRRDMTGVFVPMSNTQAKPNPVVELVDAMKKVKTDTPEAKLNTDSMSDNNGGRITFNEDLAGSNVIKGVEDRSQDSIKKK